MKLMLTARSINSIAISSTIRFLRFRKIPTTLIANSRAPTPRYQDKETIAALLLALVRTGNRALSSGGVDRHRDQAHPVLTPHLDLLRRILLLAVLAPTQRERDRCDDRDQQDAARDLQRINVVGEGEAAERFDIDDVLDARPGLAQCQPVALREHQPQLQRDDECDDA